MNKRIIFGLGAVIVLGGLLYWSSSFQSNARLVFVEGTDVACLPNGHQQIALHIHPTLSITVDGEPETIPANVGVTSQCMAEIHTHDSSGAVHIETTTASRLSQLSFADFFEVWEQPVEREGYDLLITVDGNPVDSLNDVPLEDGRLITLAYTSHIPQE